MTQEEKYVMTRTVVCLTVNASDEDYQSELLINWACNNDRYKKLNEIMSELITRSKNGEDTSDELQKVYEEKIETSGNLKSIQEALHIPEEFLEKRSKTEDYIFMQMHVRLAVIAPDEKEPEILLAWSSANYQLKNINKKLSVLYAKGKKYGFQTVSKEYNEAKGLKEQYTEEKNVAVFKLEKLAEQQQRSIENFPLKKSKRGQCH